jgi:predicted hotdog family 3-hydroxylacyl-ACP dehydratase
MCLLERVEHWDETRVVASTMSHVAPTNPLLRDGRLHAVNLCEYGAQAMALHGGLLARSQGGSALPGYLVSLRDVRLAAFDASASSSPLCVEARRIHGDATGWQYEFDVCRDGASLASGRATIVLRRAA